MASLDDLLSRPQTSDPKGGFRHGHTRDVLLDVLVMTLFVTSNPLTRSGCAAGLLSVHAEIARARLLWHAALQAGVDSAI